MAHTLPVATDAVNIADQKSGGLTHEELLDSLAALDTDARPITDIAASGGSVGNMLFEWGEEELAQPDMNNIAADGQRDFTNDAKLALRFSNFIQTSTKMLSVGDLGNRSNNVGSGTTLSQQITNRLRELRNDKEARLASSLAAKKGVDKSNGYQTSGFGAMIRTGRLAGATGADGVLSDPDGGFITTAPVGGTARALSLTLIDEAIMGAASRGGRVRYAVSMPIVIKRLTDFLMSGSAQIAAIQTNVPQSERQGVIEGDGLSGGGVAAISSVNVMVTSFGSITLVPDFQQQFDTAAIATMHLVDPDWIDCVKLDGAQFDIQDQAKVGLATDRLLVTTYGIRLPSERAHATIAAIDTTAAVVQ